MGDIHDGMCAKCGGEADDGAGGLCRTCAAIPAASTSKAQAFLLSKGWDVCVPCRENAEYDLVVLNRSDKQWQGVQVKTMYGDTVNTCRTTAFSRKAYSNEVVWFAIVDGDDVYMIHHTDANNGGRMNRGTIQKRCHPYWSDGREQAGGRRGDELPELPSTLRQPVEDVHEHGGRQMDLF